MATVKDLLAQQHQQVYTLLSLLEEELGLISKRQSEELLQLLEKKSPLLEAIQTTDTQISQIINHGNSSDITDNDQALMEEVQDCLAKCKRQTAVNEKAVEHSLSRVAHLRQILIDIRAKESLTYDKTGKPQGGTLGKGIKA